MPEPNLQSPSRRATGTRWSSRLCVILGVLGGACGPGGPESSSSTHWLRCQVDADCTNLALGARCGEDGYCTAPDGARLAQTLVLDESFSGESLDPETFGFETGFELRNAEAQAYTERLENVRIEEGALVITARAESYEAASYTSGSVHTLGRRAFTFGRFEARMRVPLGRGCSSSFWMLPEAPGAPVNTCVDPTPCYDGTWPAWGDIVIVNHQSQVPGRLLNAVSYGVWDDSVAAVRHGVRTGPEHTIAAPDSEWHLFTLDWGPERMEWSVDGMLVSTLELPPTDLYQPEGQNPFHRPFHLKLGLALGGLDQTPVAADYPQQLSVDFVRVWQWLPE